MEKSIVRFLHLDNKYLNKIYIFLYIYTHISRLLGLSIKL